MTDNIPKKDFDCVESKRQGAKLVYEQIKNMTREEELKFWQEKTTLLKKRQQELINKEKKSA